MPIHQKINSIQFLRGLAALIVVIYHAAGYIKVNYSPEVFLGDFFNFGFAGVDLFFVISGFIILFTAQQNIDNPTYLWTYLKKRFVRIYPIYWIILGLLFFLSWLITFLMGGEVFKNVFLNNSYSYLSTIILLPKHPAINAASWTLSYELFFYLVFGLLIISKKLRFVPIIILIISFYNIIVNNPTADYVKPTYFTFFFSGYNFEFIFGTIICYFQPNIRFPKILSIILILISVITIIRLGHTVGDFDTYRRILFFGIPSSIILLSLINLEKNFNMTFSKFFIDLGDASYVLYLLHFPMIQLLNKIPSLLGHTMSVTFITFYSFFVISLIVLTSIYFHKWIEKPINKLILK